MNNFHEGDLIEAVKGKAKIGGVVSNWSGGGLGIEDTGWSIEALAIHGFTVTVIERAKPALPTAMYSIVRFPNKVPAMLFEDMRWYYVGYTGLFMRPDRPLGKTPAELLAENGGDFEVFAPVAETAKRILNQVLMVIEPPISVAEKVGLDAIAAEFGVTGELGE